MKDDYIYMYLLRSVLIIRQYFTTINFQSITDLYLKYSTTTTLKSHISQITIETKKMETRSLQSRFVKAEIPFSPYNYFWSPKQTHKKKKKVPIRFLKNPVILRTKEK